MYYSEVTKQKANGIFANLLSEESIEVVHDLTARTAYFDIKNRKIIVPDLSKLKIDTTDVYNGYIIHEVGHAKFTDKDKYGNAVTKIQSSSIVNILDDIRVNRKMKESSKGIPKMFSSYYKKLLESGMFGDTSSLTNPSTSFWSRLNAHSKVGAFISIPFTDKEMSIVDLANNTETEDDYFSVVEAYRNLGNDSTEESEYQNKEEDENKEDESLTLLNGDDYDPQQPEDEDGDEFDNLFLKNKSSGDNTSSEGSSREEGSKKDQQQSDSSNEEDISTEFDKLDELLNERNRYGFNRDNEVIEIPRYTDSYKHVINLSKSSNLDEVSQVMEEKKVEFLKWLSKDKWNIYYKSNTVPDNLIELDTLIMRNMKVESEIDSMVSFFNMRQSAHIKSSSSYFKNGTIDMDRLFGYKTSTDIFSKTSITPKGKNHGFVLVIDRSSSMKGLVKANKGEFSVDSYLTNTLKQAYIFTRFCIKLNIPFEVYTFSSGSYVEGRKYISGESILTPKAVESTLIKLYDTSTSRVVIDQLMKILITESIITGNPTLQFIINSKPFYYRYGQTPTMAAMIYLESCVNQFKSTHRVDKNTIIMLTDGIPSNSCHSDVYRSHFGDTYVMSKLTEVAKESYLRNLVSSQLYLRVLADLTNSTSIHIHILSRTVKQALIPFFTSAEKSSLSRDRISRISKMNINDDSICIDLDKASDHIELTGDMSVSKLKSAFIKNKSIQKMGGIFADLVTKIAA